MNTSNLEIVNLIGKEKLETFNNYVNSLNSIYDVEQTWNNGGKKWNYEYKYRRGGKTLCAFYFKKDTLGLMIIFGKDERDKVEEIKNILSNKIVKEYDDAATYHDGKWVMFNITDISSLEDIKKLLYIKRKPNRK